MITNAQQRYDELIAGVTKAQEETRTTFKGAREEITSVEAMMTDLSQRVENLGNEAAKAVYEVRLQAQGGAPAGHAPVPMKTQHLNVVGHDVIR